MILFNLINLIWLKGWYFHQNEESIKVNSRRRTKKLIFWLHHLRNIYIFFLVQVGFYVSNYKIWGTLPSQIQIYIGKGLFFPNMFWKTLYNKNNNKFYWNKHRDPWFLEEKMKLYLGSGNGVCLLRGSMWLVTSIRESSR